MIWQAIGVLLIVLVLVTVFGMSVAVMGWKGAIFVWGASAIGAAIVTLGIFMAGGQIP